MLRPDPLFYLTRGKSTTGHYRNNIYQVISLEELSGHSDPGKIINFVGSKMKPDWYQNDTNVGSNMILSLVSKRYPNNTNLNITNITTTTKREKDAVAVVNFKKLKEEGEEKMRALRERMVKLDFKEDFVEKMLKEYSLKKIEEKLDLLMERKNIKSPAAWLRAALKNDYRGEEQESQQVRIDSRVRGNDINGSENDIDTPEWTPREEALKAIKLIQDNLSACISPIPSRKKTRARGSG